MKYKFRYPFLRCSTDHFIVPKLTNLDEKDSHEFINEFRTIPKTGSTLTIENNNLFLTRTPLELSQAFSLIRPSITSVILSETRNHNRDQLFAKRLIAVLSNLPKSVTSLRLNIMDLGLLSSGNLIEVFSAIPSTIRSLHLGYSGLLSEKHFFEFSIDFAKAFSKLPKNLARLELSNAVRGEVSWKIFNAIFSALPETLTALNLSDNDLFMGKDRNKLVGAFSRLPNALLKLNLNKNSKLPIYLKEDGLKALFASLPVKLTHLKLANVIFDHFILDHTELTAAIGLLKQVNCLDLSDNDFWNCWPSDLLAFMAELPSNITSLIIKNSKRYPGINRHDAETLKNIFSAIPPSLTHLSLRTNQIFSAIPTNTLITAFAAFPETLTSLDISNNNTQFKVAEELAAILAALANITTLNLADCHLFTKTEGDLIVLATSLPRRLSDLNLSNNSLNRKSGRELSNILTAFSCELTSLKMSKNELYELSGKALEQAFLALPDTLINLDLSGNKLHKQSAQELMLAWQGIRANISSLNLGKNGLYKKTAEELRIIFSALPRTLNTLILADNTLASLSLEELHIAFGALPGSITLDLRDNGFENSVSSELNNLLAALPDLSIRLAEGRIIRKNNGTLRAYPQVARDNFFNSQAVFRHRSKYAPLRLVFMQMMLQGHLNLDSLLHLLDYLFPNTASSEINGLGYLASTRLLVSKPPQVITADVREECLSTVHERIAGLVEGDTHLDLTRCGLNRLDKEMLKQEFKVIPRYVISISLRGNGFQHSALAREVLSKALPFIPTQIIYLDLSENGFERMTPEQLKQFLDPLPKNVRLISLSAATPLSPVKHIARAYQPTSYRQITERIENDLQKGRALLNDYTKGNSVFYRVATGHWNRHHVDNVAQIVALIDKGVIKQVSDLQESLEEIPLRNDNGSLARRLHFIAQMRPQLPMLLKKLVLK